MNLPTQPWDNGPADPDTCPDCDEPLESDGDGVTCTNPDCDFKSHPDDRYDTDPRV